MKNSIFTHIVCIRSVGIILVSVMGFCVMPRTLADYYAAQNGQTPASPYNTWATAAGNIQDAVNAAACAPRVYAARFLSYQT